MKVSPLLSAMLGTLIMAGNGLPFNMEKLDTKDSLNALMDNYQWQNRVLLIFAPDAEATALAEQTDNLSGMGAGLNDRDLVVWELVNDGRASVNGDVDASLSSQLFYDYFSVQDSEFTVILLGKDGTVKLRRTQPITSHGLFSIIDAMPMRQREMRERQG